MSVPCPTAYGTMSRIGLEGQACACDVAAASASSKGRTRRFVMFMGMSPCLVALDPRLADDRAPLGRFRGDERGCSFGRDGVERVQAEIGECLLHVGAGHRGVDLAVQ